MGTKYQIDKQAFTALFDNVAGNHHAICEGLHIISRMVAFNHIEDHTEAEDAASYICEKLITNISRGWYDPSKGKDAFNYHYTGAILYLKQYWHQKRRRAKAYTDYADQLTDTTAPAHEVDTSPLELALAENTAKLSVRELDIIKGRYFQNKTLRHLGDKWGVSHEAIRLAELRALKKLKKVLKSGA